MRFPASDSGFPGFQGRIHAFLPPFGGQGAGRPSSEALGKRWGAGGTQGEEVVLGVGCKQAWWWPGKMGQPSQLPRQGSCPWLTWGCVVGVGVELPTCPHADYCRI